MYLYVSESILESILSAEACKGGLPTIEALMSHPFFSSITLTHGPDEKGHLKIPCSTKEQLRLAQMQLEERLKEEQKMVRSQKRLVKVQEMMSSEEEKKKRKHKAVSYYIFDLILYHSLANSHRLFYLLFNSNVNLYIYVLHNLGSYNLFII